MLVFVITDSCVLECYALWQDEGLVLVKVDHEVVCLVGVCLVEDLERVCTEGVSASCMVSAGLPQDT